MIGAVKNGGAHWQGMWTEVSFGEPESFAEKKRDGQETGKTYLTRKGQTGKAEDLYT